MSIFKSYAQYYDFIYAEKNYPAEAQYVNQLIKRYSPTATTILDLGCGTGRYEQAFTKLGYKIKGVDISREMLEEALRNTRALEEDLIHGDIRNIRLNEKFDIVVSLFHVMSYQIKDEDIFSAFQTAYENLHPGGLFLFDFWHEGGVVASPPHYREKQFHKGNDLIIRKSTPTFHSNQKVITVNISLLVRELLTGKEIQFNEEHHMRYFSVSELEEKLHRLNFSVMEALEWQSNQPLNNRTAWNGFIVAKRQ